MDIITKNSKLWVNVGSGQLVEYKMKACSYSGFESQSENIDGAWARAIEEILDIPRSNNFNLLRIPISVQLGLNDGTPNPSTINVNLNPNLVGKSSLEILDYIFTQCQKRGIMIVLDNHVPNSGDSIPPLWYGTYTEAQVIQSLLNLTQRYGPFWNFVGFDLENEPHGSATWGSGNSATDVDGFYQRAGNAILAVCPRLLMFGQGTSQTSPNIPNVGTFWGENLQGYAKSPVVLSNPQKFVPTTHTYGPDVSDQPQFHDPHFTYNMPAIWDDKFGYIVKQKLGPAVVIGEFGGKSVVGSQDRYLQETLVNYLIENEITNTMFWCLNPNSSDTSGIITDNSTWATVDQFKLELLRILCPLPSSVSDNNNGTVTYSDGINSYIIDVSQPMPPVNPPNPPPSSDIYKQKFLDLYGKLHDPNNGYFSKSTGIPYHSVETLICEAPDYGHLSTSEAGSYYLELEAWNAILTGDYTKMADAWNIYEKFIPSQTLQANMSGYNPQKPATFAPEHTLPSDYPSILNTSAAVGVDPLTPQLVAKYGNNSLYGTHWLIDCDDWYGFQAKTGSNLFNTFQRGPNESVWLTIPQPCSDNFTSGGPNGYLDLFTKDPSGSYATQNKYTNAPDADSRAIQAVFLAKKYADLAGGSATVNAVVAKAAKLGDYLRGSFFDKYFKKLGCQSINVGGSGYDSCHYLQSWYYAWGCPQQPNNWGFKISCSEIHSGYQNPECARILSTNPDFTGLMCSSAPADWATSLKRQIQFIGWLQSAEGAIAGGCTNSWNGDYEAYPTGTSTFFGMAYKFNPSYNNPPSNQWFGMQTWGMERFAHYYYESKDATVLPLLTKWCNWVSSSIQWGSSIQIPSNLSWSGQPDSSFSDPNGMPAANQNLHVTITSYGQDVGLMASVARVFLFFGITTGNQTYVDYSTTIMTAVLTMGDSIGYTSAEPRADYTNFNIPVYVPPGWTGTTANGDPINQNSTFLSLRSKYKNDPMFPQLQTALNSGTVPVFHYHRFWQEVEISQTLALSYVLLTPGLTLPQSTDKPTSNPPNPPPNNNSSPFSFTVTPGGNTWTENGHSITTYQVVATNTSGNPITGGYTINITTDYMSGQSWPQSTKTTNAQGQTVYQLALPSYNFPLAPGASVNFGWNGTAATSIQ